MDLVGLILKIIMVKENTVQDRSDHWWTTCHFYCMFVSKWSDFYAKDSTNLWQTLIKWLASIREPPIAGTEGFQ